MLLSLVKGKIVVFSFDFFMKYGYCVYKNRMCEDKRYIILLVKEIVNYFLF